MSYPYAAPPGPPAPTRMDEEHLTAVGILFLVYATFTGLASLLFAAFAVLPALLSSVAERSADPPPPWFLSGMFLILFGSAAAFFFVQAALMTLAGVGLCRRRNYALCIVGASLALMNMPLGTALGIVTILLLQKPAVKAAFR